MHIVSPKKREQAIIVGVANKRQPVHLTEEYLDELSLLADTAGADVISRQIQERSSIDAAYFIGKGKATALSQLKKELKANLIIFDDDLSPAQMRNLENLCDTKIVDRSGLILDIFARRAKTREAKTQVELAQLQYLMPRLTRRWTHLSRQAGGAGIGLRGPGETQLEVDKRLISKRIAKLKDELDKIGRQRKVRRKHRTDFFKVALVGYTNVGKSTLLNELTSADVLVEDRLFATLDSTVRRMETRENGNILLVDTVGFIRKLPHNLIASFKSTLEEVRDADLLMLVSDISLKNYGDQIDVVKAVLKDLSFSEKPVMYVFNKIDKLDDRKLVQEVKNEYTPSVFVSAERGIFMPELREMILKASNDGVVEYEIRLDLTRQKTISQIYDLAEVVSRNFEDGHVNLKVRVEKKQIPHIEYLIDENLNN
ncbi:MAG: GTPase HflX [candidate division KSB1 bacterium]|nr:GTPase HflX [candidate division KSB1 bacterium]